ncbi:T9SS type B sorting domain-containing protein [Chryseobacterium sp. TY4]
MSQNFVWIKASAGGDCNGIMKLTFDFGDTSILNFNISDFCVNETVDLTQIKSDPRIAVATELKFYRSDVDLIAGSGQITNETQFDTGALTEVYVKIIFPGTACPRKGIISLKHKLVPEFTMETNLIEFCEISQKVDININPSNIISLGLKPISYTIKGPNAFVETGAYTDKTIYTTNIPGEYTVTIVTDNACSYTAAPVVLRSFDVPQITSITIESDKVTVNTISKNPNRTIEYSYDGLGSWQARNVFYNVPKGLRSFVVRYADNAVENGCTSIPKQAYILSINNVITPNGDGVNDVWKVTGLDFYEGKPTTVQIFDRFNKIVFEKSSTNTLMWDGRTNGRPVPSTTYWFIIKLPDANEWRGWIMVKNSE